MATRKTVRSEGTAKASPNSCDPGRPRPNASPRWTERAPARHGSPAELARASQNTFASGRVALKIPVAELKARLKELPKDRHVVAYCRGPYCAVAIEAVELLRRKGFEAHRIEHGVTDWRARGWRIDSAAASQ